METTPKTPLQKCCYARPITSLSLLSLFSFEAQQKQQTVAHCTAAAKLRRSNQCQSGFCHRARRSYRALSLLVAFPLSDFYLHFSNPFKHDHCEHLNLRHCQPVSSAELPTVCLMKRKWLRENSVEEKNSTTVFTFASEAETLSKRRKNSASRKLICLLFFGFISISFRALFIFPSVCFLARPFTFDCAVFIPSLILHAQSSSSSFHCSGCACLAGWRFMHCLHVCSRAFLCRRQLAALLLFPKQADRVSPAAVCCHNHLAEQIKAQKVVQLFMCLFFF